MKLFFTKHKTNKQLIIVAVVSVVLSAVLISGTYAWFASNQMLATMMTVVHPDVVSILGPNAQRMERLDLSYRDEDVDATGKVTIQRVICIQSTSDQHMIEIAHTTNLKALSFQLYKVTSISAGTALDGMTVQYNPGEPLSGSYLNREEVDANKYSFANSEKHQHNYEDYEKVQIHAEPIYYLISKKLDADKGNKVTVNSSTAYNTYYVLEITWEQEKKETDVFYVLAKNVYD